MHHMCLYPESKHLSEALLNCLCVCVFGEGVVLPFSSVMYNMASVVRVLLGCSFGSPTQAHLTLICHWS